MAAKYRRASRILGHVRDPSQAFSLKIASEAEARYDVLLPVARGKGRVRSEEDKLFAVSDHNRCLAFRMSRHIDQLDALVSEQIDDPMIRAE